MKLHNLITIITVCYNSEQNIKKTIDSVISQTMINRIELIIIDGNSSDSTLDIIKAINIEKSGIGNYILKSEEDSGVYDAMNKGAAMATGSWILYLNSGDIFYDDRVIEDFFQHAKQINAMVVYGDTVCKKGEKKIYQKSGQVKQLIYKKPFCHQSVFVQKDVQNEYMFNCKYSIQADYDLFLRIYKKGLKIERWNRIVSVFSQDGISSDPKNYGLIFAELRCLHKENNLTFINTPILSIYYLKCFLHYCKIKLFV